MMSTKFGYITPPLQIMRKKIGSNTPPPAPKKKYYTRSGSFTDLRRQDQFYTRRFTDSFISNFSSMKITK